MKLKHTLQAKEGLYLGVDPEKYFALTHAEKDGKKYVIPSKSMLTKFSENPEKWATNPPFEKTSSMTEGSLLDCMLLTPQNVDKEFIIKPEDAPRRPTVAQLNAKKKSEIALKSIKFWEDFDRKAEGREIITRNQLDNAKKALNKIKKHPDCSALLKASENQAVVVAEYNGFLAKGMFDILPNKDSFWGDSVRDLKRTSGFTPAQFRKIIRQYKYHWQAAFYLWLFNKVTGENRTKWGFVVSDSEAPYGCGMLEMHPDDIKRGHDEVFAALDKYIACVETDSFPSPWMTTGQEIVLKSFYD